MVYYSQLIGKPVIAKDFKVVGRLRDLSFVDGYKHARICSLVCATRRGIRQIPWRYVVELGDKVNDTRFRVGIYLSALESELRYGKRKELLLSSILDKQIVDVNGARIIRVNDILLGEIAGNFCIVGADVSTRGVLRRLGFVGTVGKFLPIPKENFIPWEYVEPLHKHGGELRVRCGTDKLVNIHPADLADMMHDLSADERVLVFNCLDRKKAAETLIVSNPEVRKSVFRGMSIRRIAELLGNMSHNEAATILKLMPLIKNEVILRLMNRESAKNIRKVLSYSESSAGAIMSTEFLTILDNFTVEQAISLLRKRMPSANRVHYLYVKNKEGQLIGVISLRDIVLSTLQTRVSSLIKRGIITVKIDTPADEVFNIMNKYRLLALPVLDNEGRIVGVIRLTNALNALLPLSIKKQRIPPRYKKRKQNGKNKF